MKKNLLILFGGESTEHKVSCVSAYNVINGVNKEKYNVLTVGITEDGKWYLFEGDTEKIKDGSWEKEENFEAFVSPSKSHKGIVVIKNGKAEIKGVDVCFPVLHGKNGEDGTVQGLLELSGINYVGGKTLASSLCMDKIMAKMILEKNEIPQTPYVYLLKSDYTGDAEQLKSLAAPLGFPLFVKPSNAGSSIGASKAEDLEGLKRSVENAFKYDGKALIEKFVRCREIETAVMGNTVLKFAGPGEILSESEFYDYDTKYITNADVGYGIPADISEKDAKTIKEYALKAYKALDCRGLSRLDFFIDKDSGTIYLNEINTIPGFTDISMFPKLFMSEGYTYAELLDELLETSIDG